MINPQRASVGVVALLPPADLQLFWKPSSPHGVLTTDVLTLPPTSLWSNTYDGRLIDQRTCWTFLPCSGDEGLCLSQSGFAWKDKGTGGMETNSESQRFWGELVVAAYSLVTRIWIERTANNAMWIKCRIDGATCGVRKALKRSLSR